MEDAFERHGGIEAILLDEFRDGQSFASAAEFYLKRISGRSYFVASNGDDHDAIRKKLREADDREVERLQEKYAAKWMKP